jgi:hypothetical protein
MEEAASTEHSLVAVRAALLAFYDEHTLNRPGIDGGSDPWRGWSHVSPEEVSPRAS